MKPEMNPHARAELPNLFRLTDGGHVYSRVQYRLVVEGEFPARFVLDLMIPVGDGLFPVILDGDGCWKYVTDAITAEVLRRGYILAVFNRCEIVGDPPSTPAPFASLAIWAWGYHRCMDFLPTHPRVDGARIAVVGHSRGGKAALLSGATD